MKRFSWLPRLSRRARIVRNFLLAAVLGAAVVLALGVPPLTKYGVFRRLEEEYLLTPSQLVYRMDKIVSAVYVTQGDGWITVGKVSTLGSGGTPFFHHFGVITHVLPRDSMQVVILPLSTENGSTVVAPVGRAGGGGRRGDSAHTWRGSSHGSTVLDKRCRSGRCFPPRRPGGGLVLF